MANPAVMEPGGTSRITAEVVNPDSIPLTFSWAASGGNISGAEAQATWVAPQSTGEFTISVVVKDNKGRTTSGSIGVYVQPASSSQPVPTPTPTAPKITTLTADPTVTEPSGTSSITAEVANPDNVPLTFSWVASGGSISGAAAQALWVAPQSTGEFTISVMAKDSYGRTATGTIGVQVQASSLQPTPTSPDGTRDPAIWPFAVNSPWNIGIGTGAIYNLIVWGAGGGAPATWFNADNNTVAVWKAVTTDPLRNVTVESEGFLDPDPNSPSYCVWSSNFTTKLRVPDNAVPSPPPWYNIAPPGTTGGDAVMNIHDPDGRYSWEVYGARKASNGVDWISYFFAKFDLTRDGWSGFKCKHHGRAAGSPWIAGLVRSGELRNGIKHALAAGVRSSQFNKNAPGGKSWVWPAVGSDPTTYYSSTGNVFMGSLLAIPASVNLNTVNFQTVEGKNVARAMQLYGLYLTDSTSGPTGSPILTLYLDYNARTEMPNQSSGSPFNRDLQLAAGLLRVVSNNSSISVGGGGTPLAPPAPPLAQQGSFQRSAELLTFSPRHTPSPAILAITVTTLVPLARRRVRTNRQGRSL